jgi:flagellar assembly protein FliH
MSSRVFRPSDPLEAAPVSWRRAGGMSQQQSGSSRRDAGRSGGNAPTAEQKVEIEGEIERQTQARVSAAREQGRAGAEQAAEQRATSRQAPVLAAFQAMIGDLAGQRHRLRVEAEHDAVKLAVAIARRILHRELAVDPEAILGLVKAAFAKLDARETHRLRVSLADSALLREHRDRLELPPAIEIIADGSLRPGSVIFETSRGDLDAGIDTQLAEIDRGLADVVRRRVR